MEYNYYAVGSKCGLAEIVIGREKVKEMRASFSGNGRLYTVRCACLRQAQIELENMKRAFFMSKNDSIGEFEVTKRIQYRKKGKSPRMVTQLDVRQLDVASPTIRYSVQLHDLKDAYRHPEFQKIEQCRAVFVDRNSHTGRISTRLLEDITNLGGVWQLVGEHKAKVQISQNGMTVEVPIQVVKCVFEIERKGAVGHGKRK